LSGVLFIFNCDPLEIYFIPNPFAIAEINKPQKILNLFKDYLKLEREDNQYTLENVF